MKTPQAPTRRMEARQPEVGPSLLRRSVPLSVAIHLALTALVSLPVIRPQRPIFADPIYQVALVDWPEPNYEPPVPASQPKVEKAPEKPVPKRPEPKDVVKVADSKKPKPKAEKKPEPKKAQPTSTKTGTSTGSSQPVSLGNVDQQNFQHDYYLELLRAILAREWDPPAGGEGLLRAAVHFRILRDGSIQTPEVVGSSGWSVYDRSALGAVLSAKKFPPLPEAYSGTELGLTVNFQRLAGEP